MHHGFERFLIAAGRRHPIVAMGGAVATRAVGACELNALPPGLNSIREDRGPSYVTGTAGSQAH